MDEQRNFSVLVTRTEQVQVQVQANSQEQAKDRARGLAVQSPFAATTVTGSILAQWPLCEPEEGPVVEDEPGYRWRRGWFITASLDDRSVSMTPEEFSADNPGVSFEQHQAVRWGFKPYIRKSETVFSVDRKYGYAYRLTGEAYLWSGPVADEREMRRQARRAHAAVVKARKSEAFEAKLREVEQRMQAPGEGAMLFKTRGGRWSLKSIIGDVADGSQVTLPREAWSVDIKMVKVLIERGRAKPTLSYARTGAPLAITLTDAVLRPF